ncbi:MAG TPA: hypothetical protein VH307_31305 [Streptosporangiaceae bacterium]|jgi:hypothetical protein|nr:hypothetical protein [Streptosporangiaceae bacterium]
MSMSRTYIADSGLIAIGATGLTPAFYLAPTATNDLNIFKIVPSISAGAGVPTVPSNSNLFCSLNKVTGTKAGGGAVTPSGPLQNLSGLAANTVWSSAASAAITGLTQSTEAWGKDIPFAAGASSDVDEENTNSLEINIPASSTYCFYFNVPAGPGFGANLFARFLVYFSE